jgi:hypothetical protein
MVGFFSSSVEFLAFFSSIFRFSQACLASGVSKFFFKKSFKSEACFIFSSIFFNSFSKSSKLKELDFLVLLEIF